MKKYNTSSGTSVNDEMLEYQEVDSKLIEQHEECE